MSVGAKTARWPTFSPWTRQKTWGSSIEDLATESLLAVRQAYQDPVREQRRNPGAKLADDYQVRSLPVAKRRL
jgi:hypothetical protein